MPRYRLDTNICIYLMNHSPEIVAQRFAQCRIGDVVILSITLAELEFGVAISISAQKARKQHTLKLLLTKIPALPFDAAASYGMLRTALPDRKRDALDRLIAAQAISRNLIVVTNNESDFAEYPNIQIENWLYK